KLILIWLFHGKLKIKIITMPIPQSRNPLCNPGSLPSKHYQKKKTFLFPYNNPKKGPLRKTKVSEIAKEMISNSLRDSSDDTDKKQKKPRNHHKYRL